MLRHDTTLTAAKIAKAFTISTRQAERLLAALKKKNLLRRIGPDKGGHWEVVE
jgi:predicted HTH transcriptional regulator